MSDAARRPVGRTLAALAAELDSLALEIEGRELTADDLPFLDPAYAHLQGAVEALDAALLGAYAQIEGHRDALELAA